MHLMQIFIGQLLLLVVMLDTEDRKMSDSTRDNGENSGKDSNVNI